VGNRLTQVHLEKWPLKWSVCTVCVHRRYTKFIGSFFKIPYFQIHRQTWVESDRIDIGSGQIVGERGGTAFPFRFGGGTPFP